MILGEECARAKPFPDPYLAGLQVLGLEPQQVVVFEDSPAGEGPPAAAAMCCTHDGGLHPRLPGSSLSHVLCLCMSPVMLGCWAQCVRHDSIALH